jgi:hypothetical protein
MQPTAPAHIADFAWSLWLQAGLYQIILTLLNKLKLEIFRIRGTFDVFAIIFYIHRRLPPKMGQLTLKI